MRQPKLKFKETEVSRIVSIISWIILLASIVLVLIRFNSMPDHIPTHYNFKGEVYRYGTKYTMLILLVITVFVFVPLRLLRRLPHIFNFVVTITDENAERQYLLAVEFLDVLNLYMIITLMFTPVFMALNTNGTYSFPGVLFALFSVVSLFLIISIYIIISIKKR